MNRRDFFLLRMEPRGLQTMPRDVELSCEQLYMRCLDTQVTGAQPGNSADSAEPSPWGGEPAAAFAERTRQQVFEALDRELREVDVLRVVDSQWLVGDLRRDFENVMDLFRARGGRVQVQ
jgi:hypothetical protein